MNYAAEDIKKIARMAVDAPEPYREWLLGLVEDWKDLMVSDVEDLKEGLAKSINLANHITGRLNQVEEILKLPLCEDCGGLIERNIQ